MTIPADLYISIRPIAGMSFVSLSRMGEHQALTRQAAMPEEALAEAIKAWPQWAKDHPPVSTEKKHAALPPQRKAPVDDDEDLIGGEPVTTADDEDLVG